MGKLTRSADIAGGDWAGHYWSIPCKESEERRNHDAEEGDGTEVPASDSELNQGAREGCEP